MRPKRGAVPKAATAGEAEEAERQRTTDIAPRAQRGDPHLKSK